MRLISQSGLIDVPYEMTAFHIVGGNIRMNMVGDTGKGTVMAVYSSQDKAEKAMEMLREAYIGTPIVLNNIELTEDVEKLFKEWKLQGIIIHSDMPSKVEFLNNRYFRFPPDAEIEV